MFPEYMDNNIPKVSVLEQCKNTKLTAYNGTIIPHYGTISLNCQKNDRPWSDHVFYVANSSGPIIIGLPSCQSLGLVTLHCAVAFNKGEITNTRDLIKNYPHCFDRLGKHAQRKCPLQLREEIKRTLCEMEKNGIIRKVTDPSAWVSSLTYPRKSNGELRICPDPKDLNKNSMRTFHKTPTVEEVTHKFHGSKVFSKLDAKNGYWGIKLDAESQLLTTFNTPFSRYCFVRMPFGLIMSQDVFQQRMDMILEQCSGTIGISDDVVVYGRDKSEHDAHLNSLMQVASQEGLVFNSKKCEINVDSVKFFDTIYDSNGAHPDPDKISAIRDLPSPSTVVELQHILGIVTYLSPFIPNLANQTASLRELLKKDT